MSRFASTTTHNYFCIKTHGRTSLIGVPVRLLGNIIWMLLGGIFTALYWSGIGCLFCITIIGIPLGRQAFKMAKLSLLPFGATVR